MRTFFRTNRNTCCEWLNRIQESTTKLANLCGFPEKALRNGFLWLQHLKNTSNTQGSAFENAVVTVVDSLIQLHCYQGVKGILDWARKEVGRDFFWLHAAIPKANGRCVCMPRFYIHNIINRLKDCFIIYFLHFVKLKFFSR